MNPTFVAFTPWTTMDGYVDFLRQIDELGLVANVAPIQYAIRLLIPDGSRLLELPEVMTLVQPFDPVSLVHPWSHLDPAVDALHGEVLSLTAQGASDQTSRAMFFDQLWALATRAAGQSGVSREARGNSS